MFDAVGSGGVAPRLTRTDAATLRTATGKPIVIYVGADYCPFCASERWSLVVALSRFGTFRDLGLTRSSPSDVYPNTATFSFRGTSYASEWVELSTVETADRFGSPRERPDATQQASLDRFDPKGSIPFVSLADRYVTIGAGYPTDVLRGKDWQDVTAGLPSFHGFPIAVDHVEDAIRQPRLRQQLRQPQGAGGILLGRLHDESIPAGNGQRKHP